MPTPEPWTGECPEDSPKLILKPIPRRMGSSEVYSRIPGVERIVELAKTCHGSRILQDEICNLRMLGNTHQLTEISNMILSRGVLLDLTYDKFGNYFIQTLLGGVDAIQFVKFVEILTEDHKVFAQLATHTFGSHVVQLLMSLASTNKQASTRIVEALSKNIVYISSDYLGSICLLHAVDSLPTSSRLVASMAQFTRQLSVSRHGHTVIMKTLEKACSQTLGAIEKELAVNLEELVGDNFGFRVIEKSLELEKAGRVNPKYSRVTLFTKSLRFNYIFFPLINYLILNFSQHDAVQTDLLPKIFAIVEHGRVPDEFLEGVPA